MRDYHYAILEILATLERIYSTENGTPRPTPQPETQDEPMVDERAQRITFTHASSDGICHFFDGNMDDLINHCRELHDQNAQLKEDLRAYEKAVITIERTLRDI